MRAIVITSDRGTPLRCLVPEGRRERMRGLRKHGTLGPGTAMWFPRTSSVHTFGMTASVTVVRVDTRGRVLDVRLVRPRRIVWPSLGVRGVLECRPDVDLRVGDRLTTTEDDPYAGQPPRPAAPVTTHEPS